MLITATLLPDLKLKIMLVLLGMTKPLLVVTPGAVPNCTLCDKLPVVIRIRREVNALLTTVVVLVCSV